MIVNEEIGIYTEDDIGRIANYVYTNYPDNLGFKVEDLEIVKKLKIKK